MRAPVVFAREAVGAIFAKVKRDCDGDVDITLGDLTPLHTFRWLLMPDEERQVIVWTNLVMGSVATAPVDKTSKSAPSKAASKKHKDKVKEKKVAVASYFK